MYGVNPRNMSELNFRLYWQSWLENYVSVDETPCDAVTILRKTGMVVKESLADLIILLQAERQGRVLSS